VLSVAKLLNCRLLFNLQPLLQLLILFLYKSCVLMASEVRITCNSQNCKMIEVFEERKNSFVLTLHSKQNKSHSFAFLNKGLLLYHMPYKCTIRQILNHNSSNLIGVNSVIS